MSLIKVVLPIYVLQWKKMEEFGWFLTLRIDFESQNFAIFTARFMIGCWSAKGLLKQGSAYFHSINPGFDVEVDEKILNGI